MARLPSSGQVRAHDELAVVRPGREAAAVDPRRARASRPGPARRRSAPRAGRAEPVARPRRRTACGSRAHDERVARARVAQRVGQGLLQDPVGGEVDARREAVDRRPRPRVDVEARRRACPRPARRAAARPGWGAVAAGVVVVAQQAEQAPQLGERLAPGVADRAERLARARSGSSATARPDSDWMTIVVTRCATMSCSSRAIRARSRPRRRPLALACSPRAAVRASSSVERSRRARTERPVEPRRREQDRGRREVGDRRVVRAQRADRQRRPSAAARPTTARSGAACAATE